MVVVVAAAVAAVVAASRRVVAAQAVAAQPLASLFPNGKALEIPNRDHMLAVGDKVFKAGVIDFLNARP